MRLAILSLVLLAGPAWSQGNTLTPEEAKAGWLLLWDGVTTTGWKTLGDVEIKDRKLFLPTGSKLEWTFFYPKGTDTEIANFGRVLASTIDDRLVVQGTGEIARIKILPQGAKSLFNGKDLTGWKVFDGKKSKFTVEDGVLRVVDGPGDLQTEGKYKNFLLQLECKTHGKGLNSGVFFRCRPNEYQNGYEAQIQNAFLAEPKDYVVEEYDPKTHTLADKRKMKSTAADFGTGAIYRRIPTTKQVANDGEWFTLTVIAQDNHLATWVNGVPTVDWYDNRPASDNARTGYRAAAGHISLQGHDPTTDLSFRNIRIIELPD